MAGNRGVSLEAASIARLFGEDQARYLIAAPQSALILDEAKKAGVPASDIGHTGGETLEIKNVGTLAISKLKSAHEAWFPAYMSGEEIPPTN